MAELICQDVGGWCSQSVSGDDANELSSAMENHWKADHAEEYAATPTSTVRHMESLAAAAFPAAEEAA